MAEVRVDVLEVVEVEQHQPEVLAQPPTADVALEHLHQRAPVGEAGQRVAVGQGVGAVAQLDEHRLAGDQQATEDDVAGRHDDELGDVAARRRAGVIEERHRVHGHHTGDVGHRLARRVEVRGVDEDEQPVEAGGGVGAARRGNRRDGQREAHRAREVRDERLAGVPVDDGQAGGSPDQPERRAGDDDRPVPAGHVGQQQECHRGARADQVERPGHDPGQAPLLGDRKTTELAQP